MNENRQLLDISWGAIIKVFFALVVIYLLYQIAEILVWSIFALVISVLFNPVVDILRRMKIPRVVGVVLVYFGFFGMVSLLFYVMIPGLYKEVRSFSEFLPDYIERISPFLSYVGIEGFATLDDIVGTLRDSADQVARGVFSGLALFFGGMSTTFFIITLAIFLSLEGNGVEKAISLLVSEKQKNQVLSTWKKCRDQVGSWFLIRIIACLFVAVSSFFVFYLFDVRYALVFAIIGGLFNFIPFVGPSIAALMFFIITSLDSVPQAIFIFIAFMIIQAIEGSVLTPALSKKIMGVSPALVLISIVIGGSLWGVLGAFLAIPLLGIIFEFTKAFLEKRKKALSPSTEVGEE